MTRIIPEAGNLKYALSASDPCVAQIEPREQMQICTVPC